MANPLAGLERADHASGATGSLVGTFFLNSLFLQNVLGSSALITGVGFLPLVLVTG